jgi:hypothetical protein
MYFNGRNSELNGSKQSSNKSALASYEWNLEFLLAFPNPRPIVIGPIITVYKARDYYSLR